MKIMLEIAGNENKFNVALPDGWTIEDVLDLLSLHRMSTFAKVHDRVRTEDYKLKDKDVLKVYPIRAAIPMKVYRLLKVLESKDVQRRQIVTYDTPITDLCSLCKDAEAIVWYKYFVGGSEYGYKLCERCFVKSVEKKVFRIINWHNVVQKNDFILAAVSGEKDSALTLYFLKEYQKCFGDFDLRALIVDCGLGEYDKRRIERATELCERLNVDHSIIPLKERYGSGIRDISSKIKEGKIVLNNSICDICVVLRSKVIYDTAYRLHCNKIAEGRNSEERTASLLVASVYGTPQMRMVAREPIIPGWYYNIPRIRILVTLSPKEIGLYLHVKKIPVLFHQESQCDFYEYRASGVGKYADIIEEMFPGFVPSITLALRDKDTVFHDATKKRGVCQSCGVEFFSLTDKRTCNFCRITKDLALQVPGNP